MFNCLVCLSCFTFSYCLISRSLFAFALDFVFLFGVAQCVCCITCTIFYILEPPSTQSPAPGLSSTQLSTQSNSTRWSIKTRKHRQLHYRLGLIQPAHVRQTRLLLAMLFSCIYINFATCQSQPMHTYVSRCLKEVQDSSVHVFLSDVTDWPFRSMIRIQDSRDDSYKWSNIGFG